MNKSNYDDLMKELRQEYLESFEDKFEYLQQLYAKKDWNSIELEFHKLKGTGATYGAPEVSELCQQLERICGEKSTITEDLLLSSIALLTSIRDKYLIGLPFDLSTNEEFEKIKSL